MIAKGLEPGAALVLLLAGPATNLATIAVVRQFLGTSVLAIYLASIAACSLFLGWMVNLVYAGLGLAPESAASGLEHASRGPVTTLAGVALAALLVWKALELRLLARWGAALRQRLAPLGIDPTSRPVKATVLLALLAVWGSTSLGVVRPGEVGFRLRFGRVVTTVEDPGLTLLLPWPLESLETARAAEVRGLRLGEARPRRGEPDTLAELARAAQDARAEVVTGDENVLRVTHSVQWRLSDAWRSRYATGSPEELLRSLAASTLTRSVARRTTDELLVGDRDELESELALGLQLELDALDAGIEIVAVRVADVHAPPEVHDAYRDVASALEDRERQLRRAERYQKELIARARADAYGRVQRAEARAEALLQRARGESGAFLELFAAQAPAPELFRARLRLEAAERALPGSELVLVLDPRIDPVPVERRPQAATDPPQPWEEDE
jgi:HflK protein